MTDYSINVITNDNTIISEEVEKKFKSRDKTSSKRVNNYSNPQSENLFSTGTKNKTSKSINPVSMKRPSDKAPKDLKHTSSNNLKSAKAKSKDIIIIDPKKTEELDLCIRGCMANGYEFEKTLDVLGINNLIIDRSTNSPNSHINNFDDNHYENVYFSKTKHENTTPSKNSSDNSANLKVIESREKENNKNKEVSFINNNTDKNIERNNKKPDYSLLVNDNLICIENNKLTNLVNPNSSSSNSTKENENKNLSINDNDNDEHNSNYSEEDI